ncbi:MAG: hypothetical protein V3575_03560 [Candidatus Absconditabacteria bacterium]
MQSTQVGYDKFIVNLKDKLRIKVLSIYLLEEEEKNDIINLINQNNDIEKLYEVDSKLNQILDQVGEITIALLENTNKSVLADFRYFIQKEIIEKIRVQEALEQLDLDELEKSFDLIIDSVFIN